MNRLIVGVDLDGVLGNFTLATRSYIAKKQGISVETVPEITQWDMWIDLKMEKDVFWDLVRQGIIEGEIFSNDPVIIRDGETYEEMYQVLKRFCTMHDVYIVTARNTPGCETQSRVATFKWLEEKWPGMPWSGIIISNDKTCINADIFIEDSVDNMKALLEAGTLPICMDQPWNQDWPAERITKWSELEPLLERLEQDYEEEHSLATQGQ